MKATLGWMILALSCILSTNAIRWKDCGSKGSKVQSISVTGCQNVPTCPLPRGQNASITVKFYNSESFSKAHAVVHGILADLPVPFPIPNPDGCTDCGLKCPVKSGMDNAYHTNIYIKESYPKVRVVVKWELQDENDNDIFCIELPAEVTDGKRKVNALN